MSRQKNSARPESVALPITADEIRPILQNIYLNLHLVEEAADAVVAYLNKRLERVGVYPSPNRTTWAEGTQPVTEYVTLYRVVPKRGAR